MRRVVEWAANNPLLAILFAVVVMVAGGWAAVNLPIDAVPDVTNIQVQVVTRAPALSAQEVEMQVTQPVERAMAGIPGLTLTRSVTKLGVSVVTLIFQDDIDIYFARAQVNERLATVREMIPPSVGRPELGPIATGLGEVFMFELKSDPPGARSPEELRTIVEWQIGPRLRQVPGVIEVVGYGGALKQYRVTLDPGRLAAHNISVEEVRDALERDNRVAGGGYVEQASEQVVLRADARFRGLEDIAATLVRTDERGIPIRVGDLGIVDTGPALRQGAMTRDGRGEIVGGSVLMLKGENSRVVVDRVKEAIRELAPRLPAGVVIDPWYDRAAFIDEVLATVAKNLSEGALIVVICLFLTLGTIRAGLLVAGAIPFAMLVGFLGLLAIGYSGNVMSLGAIDFGIVVEGAVVVVEHAVTHGLGAAEREARRRAIAHAMGEVARPAAFGVVITLLVFLPLATLQDVEGKMFRPVVYSLCFMLFGALVYALVVIPAVAPLTLKQAASQGKEPFLMRQLRRIYDPVLEKALAWPKATLAIAFGLALAMLATGAQIGAEFLPRIFEGSLAIDAVRPPSVSLTQAIDLASETERTLKEFPEVETVIDRIGRPENSVDPSGPEASDCFIILKPRHEWRPGMTPEKLVEELSARVDARIPATVNAFSQPIEMRVNDLIAGVKSDVAIKVFGDDLESISEAADKIRKTIAQVPGAADVKMDIPFGLPAINIVVDRDRVARLGVSPGLVLDTVTMTRAGLGVGVVREGERIFDLVLRVGGEAILDEEDVERLPVATSQGHLVPLRMLADVSTERTVVLVSREQMKRRIAVQANVRGRDMVGFVKEAQARVATLGLPKSIEVVWGGQFQNFNRARARLATLVPVAFVVIAVMLVVTFRSVKYMIVTVLNLPFALAGGVLALVLRGLPFSIPAGVGFIALSGVSVITGIVMTSKLLDLPPEMPALDRVRRASKEAFRAPVSTALVAAVGFVPAALATGTGAEVQRPLATVVIGGLVVAMVISMVALPAMLLIAARMGKRAGEGGR